MVGKANSIGNVQSRRGSFDVSFATKLLMRNINRLGGTNILIAGLQNDDAIALLAPSLQPATVKYLTFDFAAFLGAKAAMPPACSAYQSVIYSTSYEVGRVHDLVVMYLQKGKELNQMLLQSLAGSLLPGARLLLVGENGAGIRSSRSLLETAVGPVRYSDAARHCVIYEATLTNPEASLRSNHHSDWYKFYEVEIGEKALSIASLPGVFSHGRLDEGTRLLINHLPSDLNGSILDFGCGSGVIGAFVKSHFPNSEVTLSDVSAFAIASSKETFRANRLNATAIVPSHIFSDLHSRFNCILSNPPFHEGVRTQYETAATFIAEAALHLHPGGMLLLVANRFLHYEELMQTHIGIPTLIAKNGTFKVLMSKKRA